MLKEELLKELESHRNTPISGQMLAERYHVSRNAVWKAINALKNEGYEIVSSSKTGYYIPEKSDVLSGYAIQAYLPEAYRNLEIRTYDSVDSTNNEAKRILATETCGNMLLVAKEQKSGRGRQGRSFYSPGEAGIYMTLIYKLKEDIQSPALITMAAAVGVVRAIESLSDYKMGLKWVNDIYYGSQKAGGILTEAVTDLETGKMEYVVVGIGLNIRKQELPEELKRIVVSLDMSDVNRNRLIAEITRHILDLYQEMNPESYMEDYIGHSIVLGKEIEYEKESQVFTATVTGISLDGRLEIRNEAGEKESLTGGEIHIRNMY